MMPRVVVFPAFDLTGDDCWYSGIAQADDDQATASVHVHVLSYASDQLVSLASTVASVKERVDSLQLSKEDVVVGHGVGSQIALAYLMTLLEEEDDTASNGRNCAELPRLLCVGGWCTPDIARQPTLTIGGDAEVELLSWCNSTAAMDFSRLSGKTRVTAVISDNDPCVAVAHSGWQRNKQLWEQLLGALVIVGYARADFSRHTEPLVHQVLLHHVLGRERPPLRFEKWQGLGNDFILLDERDAAIHFTAENAVALCDRHTGVGADGLAMISEPTRNTHDAYDWIYTHLQPDGSLIEMCGNGVRCLAKFAAEKQQREQGNDGEQLIRFLTPAGIIITRVLADGRVLVDMGYSSDLRLNFSLDSFTLSDVNSGVPHVVMLVNDSNNNDAANSDGGVDIDDLQQISSVGARLERHTFFAPSKTNVNFALVLGDRELRVRTWERGVGLTRACGTGACASVCVCAALQLIDYDEDVTVHLPGGDLTVRVARGNDGRMWQCGPAVRVFRGCVE